MTAPDSVMLPEDSHTPSATLSVWLVDLVAAAPVVSAVARAQGLIGGNELTDGRAENATPQETARAALRIILAGFVGRESAARPFRLAPGGKPMLDGRAECRPLHFSLAHCDTAALVAISQDGPVGVDIEAPRPVRIADHRRRMLIEAAASLAPSEQLPDGPGEARFLQGWVRLEALAKATGEGLGALLGRLGDDASPIAETHLNGVLVRTRDIQLPTASPLFAAVAGIDPTLASAASPLARDLPCEAARLEQWIACAPRSGWY